MVIERHMIDICWPYGDMKWAYVAYRDIQRQGMHMLAIQSHGISICYDREA